MDEITHLKEAPKNHTYKTGRTVWASIEYLSYMAAKSVGETLSIMRKEAGLFTGTTVLLLGLLNWSSNKYCDGNTADYLSCTRPNTYYYYGGFEIALIIAGVLLILVWYVKNRRRA